MNKRIKELAQQADLPLIHDNFLTAAQEKFAELIIWECAQLARDTDLEDVEGGDSDVLRAAKLQILEHFGVEE
jgi:hypothetical protein